MDRILIDDLTVEAHVGVPDEERRTRQELRLDVELELDLTAAGETDDFTRTVDYAAVTRRLIEIVQNRPRKLIEALAAECAEALLCDFPIVAVRLRVRKPRALAEFGARFAAVVVERRRA